MSRGEDGKDVAGGAKREGSFEEREKFLHDVDTFGVGCLLL